MTKPTAKEVARFRVLVRDLRRQGAAKVARSSGSACEPS